MNEACIWQYIFLGEVGGGGGGVKWCWHNIRRGGYLMLLNNILAATFWQHFFNQLSSCPKPTLRHWWRDSLNHLMLISVYYLIQPKGHRAPHNKVGSQSPAKYMSRNWTFIFLVDALSRYVTHSTFRLCL